MTSQAIQSRTDPADMAVRRNKIQRQERGLSEG